MISPPAYLFLNYGTKFQNEEGLEIPNSIFYTYALFYFLYRLCDEMDGKQARKTGNSSALGLLFDHGCDSFTVGVVGLFCMKTMQLGDTLFNFFLICVITLTFHAYTIEEYWVGTMQLGRLNAVSDGSIWLISLFIFMGIFGNGFWKHIVFEDRQITAG